GEVRRASAVQRGERHRTPRVGRRVRTPARDEVDEDLEWSVKTVEQAPEAAHPAFLVLSGRVEVADRAGGDDGGRRLQVGQASGWEAANADRRHRGSSPNAFASRPPSMLMALKLTIARPGDIGRGSGSPVPGRAARETCSR